MAEQYRRSVEPLDLGRLKHGAKGYEAGCGCFTCRRGHNEKQSRYAKNKRAREKAEKDARGNAPAGAGPLEIATRAEIAELGLDTREAARWIEQAITQAEAVDKLRADQRWHMVGSANSKLGELMDRLHGLKGAVAAKAGESGDEEADDFVKSLTRPSGRS
jgi:hypothetical protein